MTSSIPATPGPGQLLQGGRLPDAAPHVLNCVGQPAFNRALAQQDHQVGPQVGQPLLLAIPRD